MYFRNTATIRERTYNVVGIEPRLDHRFDMAGIGLTVKVGARLLGETGRRRQYRTQRPISDAGDQIDRMSVLTCRRTSVGSWHAIAARPADIKLAQPVRARSQSSRSDHDRRTVCASVDAGTLPFGSGR